MAVSLVLLTVHYPAIYYRIPYIRQNGNVRERIPVQYKHIGSRALLYHTQMSFFAQDLGSCNSRCSKYILFLHPALPKLTQLIIHGTAEEIRTYDHPDTRLTGHTYDFPAILHLALVHAYMRRRIQDHTVASEGLEHFLKIFLFRGCQSIP